MKISAPPVDRTETGDGDILGIVSKDNPFLDPVHRIVRKIRASTEHSSGFKFKMDVAEQSHSASNKLAGGNANRSSTVGVAFRNGFLDRSRVHGTTIASGPEIRDLINSGLVSFHGGDAVRPGRNYGYGQDDASNNV